MGVNSLPKTVTRQRRGCDLNLGPTAPESSTLTTRLPSHPLAMSVTCTKQQVLVQCVLYHVVRLARICSLVRRQRCAACNVRHGEI